jgi:putative transposon-encoded protein
MHIHQRQVKTIGSNGQISLGKEFAGKMVLVEQIEEGTWIIKCGEKCI